MRPLSILRIILLEKIAVAYLRDELESKLSPYQHGFRTGSSCNHAKLAMTFQAMMGDRLFVLLIDIEKAYDSVKWDELREMIHRNFTGRTRDVLLISWHSTVH